MKCLSQYYDMTEIWNVHHILSQTNLWNQLIPLKGWSQQFDFFFFCYVFCTESLLDTLKRRIKVLQHLSVEHCAIITNYAWPTRAHWLCLNSFFPNCVINIYLNTKIASGTQWTYLLRPITLDHKTIRISFNSNQRCHILIFVFLYFEKRIFCPSLAE